MDVHAMTRNGVDLGVGGGAMGCSDGLVVEMDDVNYTSSPTGHAPVSVPLAVEAAFECWDAEDQAIFEYLLLDGGASTLPEAKHAGHDSPKSEKSDSSTKRKLTAAERRARHREVVKRSYHRNKETLTNLRESVKKLEAEFKRLSMAKEQGMTAQPEGALVNATDVAKLERLKKVCADLCLSSRVLKDESEQLRSAIQNHQHFISRVEECMHEDDTSESEGESDDSAPASIFTYMDAAGSPTSVEEDIRLEQRQKRSYTVHAKPTYLVDLSPPARISRDTRTEIGFKALHPTNVQALVDSTFENILRFTFSGRAVSSGARVMGWEDKRLVDGTTVNFSLKKPFEGYSSLDLTMKTWQCFSDPACTEQKFRGLMSLRILQRVSDDVLVAMRDTVSPCNTKVFRCVYLLFRVRSPHGFIICARSFDEWGTPEQKLKCRYRRDGMEIQWIDMFGWFHFTHMGYGDANAFMETGTQVEYGGSMNYGDTSHVAMLAMDTLSMVMRWEGLMVGPMFHLPPSAP